MIKLEVGLVDEGLMNESKWTEIYELETFDAKECSITTNLPI